MRKFDPSRPYTQQELRNGKRFIVLLDAIIVSVYVFLEIWLFPDLVRHPHADGFFGCALAIFFVSSPLIIVVVVFSAPLFKLYHQINAKTLANNYQLQTWISNMIGNPLVENYISMLEGRDLTIYELGKLEEYMKQKLESEAEEKEVNYAKSLASRLYSQNKQEEES
ncbi:MAG: hypothetical protein PHO57_02985 [Acidithiobacillus sp.]|nr:hypothetical protein [Acidithiobacillus sp.]